MTIQTSVLSLDSFDFSLDTLLIKLPKKVE